MTHDRIELVESGRDTILKKGEWVIVDIDFANNYFAKVIEQTPSRIFTRCIAGNEEFTIMTYRLTKTKAMDKEKRLSKKQENVLVILCEGFLYEHQAYNDIQLEDADKNSYFIRKNTFNILKNGGYIISTSSPAMDTKLYSLTDKAWKYLEKYCYEEIKDFIEPLPVRAE